MKTLEMKNEKKENENEKMKTAGVKSPIFAPKMKTALPTGMGSRSCEELPVIWTRKVEFFFWSAPKVGQEK